MKRDMRKYILRKLVELIFTLLFVTLLSFLLMRLSSVDPATAYAKRMIGNPTAEQIEKIRIQLGFDKPLLVQYGRWVWDLLHFDLGVSLANGHDVWTDIATAFPKTLRFHLRHPLFTPDCPLHQVSGNVAKSNRQRQKKHLGVYHGSIAIKHMVYNQITKSRN